MAALNELKNSILNKPNFIKLVQLNTTIATGADGIMDYTIYYNSDGVIKTEGVSVFVQAFNTAKEVARWKSRAPNFTSDTGENDSPFSIALKSKIDTILAGNSAFKRIHISELYESEKFAIVDVYKQLTTTGNPIAKDRFFVWDVNGVINYTAYSG